MMRWTPLREDGDPLALAGEEPPPLSRDYPPLSWEYDGAGWPNADTSRFVQAGGVRWHVQVMGRGPVLLLLHGTGAASHSWRDLAPLLAERYTVLVPDLPGHGFTQLPPAGMLALPGMASLLEELLRTMGSDPVLVAGHSAGAAIAARMCLDRSIAPDWLVSLNGALLPLAGLPGRLFSPMARFLAHRSVWARLFARRAEDRRVVERLIDRTGSVIEPNGIDLYARLLRNTRHSAAALGMMASWDLDPLLRNLPGLANNLLLVVGDNDRMVPPEQAERVREMLPAARIRRLPDCGHLLHEERPRETAALIMSLREGAGGSEPA